jgi:iron complex outermembrane receptor protein
MISNISRARARAAMRWSTLFGTASFVAIAATGAAYAQSQMPPQAAQMLPPEQVLITGSLIQGAAAVGVPVSDLRPADFVETGQLTVTDILKTIPALRIDAEASPTYGGGTLSFEQNVQIHGLGTGSGVETLLLVNGLRWPPQNYSNDTVNPSIIPQIAIERVDVLTAGASAVYGSDATAGVINIILRRGYNGAISQGSITSNPDIGYLAEQASQLFGKSWDSGNITVSYSFTESRNLPADKRSYYTLDFTPWGLLNDTPLGSSIPGIVHPGSAATAAGSPAGETAANGTLFCSNCLSIPKGQNGTGLSWASIQANPGVKNERNAWLNSDARPRLQSNAVTGTFDQNLTNNFFGFGSIALFADGFYSNQRGKQIYPPGNGEARQILETNLVVPTSNPYYPTGPKANSGAAGCPVTGAQAATCVPNNLRVDYSFALEVPTFIVGGEVATHWDAGFNFDKLPFDWRGKATYSMSDDRNYGDASNAINKNNLSAALGNTVAATGGFASYTKPAAVPYLNIFCDPAAFTCNDPATLAYIVGYRTQHEQFKIQEVDVNFDGPLFDLPGGTVRAAIAGQHLSEHWSFVSLQNDNTASTALITNSHDFETQRSTAFFGQLDVPIFGEGNALPFFQSLVVEAGYRYDKYNNLSDPVYTPKVAVNWGVGAGLTLRGAWGKSFRVPSFAENSPVQSTISGVNPLGLAAAADVAILGCGSVNGSPSGVAIPGSLTALLNPTCSANAALRQPGSLDVSGGGSGAAVILRDGQTLGPQTLKQWSTGFNFTPTEPIFGVNLSGLDLDFSWFNLQFRGLISANGLGANGARPNPDDPVSRSAFTVIPHPELPITDPANASFLALVQALAAYPSRGGGFDPAAIPNIKFISDTALTNLGSRNFSGIDFNGRYDFDLGRVGLNNFGSINIGAAGFYEITDKTRTTPVSPIIDTFVGQNSGNRLQRVRYRLGWADDTWSVTAFANYFGHGAINTNGNNLLPPCFYASGFSAGSCFAGSPYYGPLVTFPNFSPATVYFDLTLGYQTGEMPANEYLRNIGIQLTVNDIFDKPPPFQVGARGSGSIRAFDNAFTDLQRTFTITVTKVW